ncbi:MAG: hypothetical protein KHW81_16020 [[Clostridium] innocuum]|nr:hypothetical protein [[Clostridium] innocuum]MBS5685879.1 hypothetical protein [[Clostridium] innocuum]
MKKRLNKLKDKRGNAYPYAIAIALCMILVFVGISEYVRLMIIAQGVRDAVQSSVIAVNVGNYDEVYDGIREGYSGGYRLNGSSWIAVFDRGDVYRRLDKLLGLTVSGNAHVHRVSGKEEYRIYGLSVSNQNAPLTPIDPSSSKKFTTDVTLILEVPVKFGTIIPNMKIKVKVKAGYIPKF